MEATVGKQQLEDAIQEELERRQTVGKEEQEELDMWERTRRELEATVAKPQLDAALKKEMLERRQRETEEERERMEIEAERLAQQEELDIWTRELEEKRKEKDTLICTDQTPNRFRPNNSK